MGLQGLGLKVQGLGWEFDSICGCRGHGFLCFERLRMRTTANFHNGSPAKQDVGGLWEVLEISLKSSLVLNLRA